MLTILTNYSQPIMACMLTILYPLFYAYLPLLANSMLLMALLESFKVLRTRRDLASMMRTFPFELPVTILSPLRSKDATMFNSDYNNSNKNNIMKSISLVKYLSLSGKGGVVVIVNATVTALGLLLHHNRCTFHRTDEENVPKTQSVWSEDNRIR